MLDNKVLIIAEAGVNHNGDINLAKQMIESAKEFGADIVKFQCYITENLVTQKTPTAQYQKKNGSISSQYEMLKKLELNQKEHIILIDYCKKKKINYLASVFDIESLNFLRKQSSSIKIRNGSTSFEHNKEVYIFIFLEFEFVLGPESSAWAGQPCTPFTVEAALAMHPCSPPTSSPLLDWTRRLHHALPGPLHSKDQNQSWCPQYLSR